MKKSIASGMALLLIAAGMLQAWVGQAAEVAPALPGDTTHSVAVENDGVLDLYFIGKRGSQIEPCGCQTKQRGGTQYEAAIYGQHKGRPELRLDAGEWTRGGLDGSPITALQTGYLLRALKVLKMDALNVSLNDIQFQQEFFKNLDKDFSADRLLEPMVSANIFDRKNPDKLFFAAERIVERKLADGKTIKIGITGATTLSWSREVAESKIEFGEYVVKAPEAALKPVIENLRPKVDLLIVLLATLNSKEAVAITQAFPQADFIVTTASFPDSTSLILQDGPVYLLHTPNLLGKELGIVSIKPQEPKRWTTAAMPQSLYVSLDLPANPEIKGLIESFKDDTVKLDVKIPPHLEIKEVYAGSGSCMSCHEAIYKSWAKTKHAHALDTLINKRQQFNPECVKCHVTGYQTGDKKENGFYSAGDQASLDKANVQCEVCHGPAMEHVKREQQILMHVERWKTPAEFQEIVKQAKLNRPPVKVESKKCMDCHQGENDPPFQADPAGVYAKKVRMIDHSEVPAADRKTPAPAPISDALLQPAPPVEGANRPAGAAAGTPAWNPEQAPATGPTPIVTTPQP